MDYVNLGRSGLKVSRICLGMMSYGTPEWRDWVLDEEDSRPFIQKALELGINFFDTANAYANGVSEEITGRALKDFAKRDEVVLATKRGMANRFPEDKVRAMGRTAYGVMWTESVGLVTWIVNPLAA